MNTIFGLKIIKTKYKYICSNDVLLKLHPELYQSRHSSMSNAINVKSDTT